MAHISTAQPVRWAYYRFTALLLALPACLLAYYLGNTLSGSQANTNRPDTPSAAPAPTPPRVIGGLEAAADDLDVGEVWEDPDFVRAVTLTNRTDREVRVTGMTGGCECTAVEPKAFTLAAGQSQQILVKIDLTHRQPHQFGVDQRELAVSVYPVFADRGAAASGWMVRGVVKSRVSVDGRELTFVDLCGQGVPVTRSMKATAHVPLTNLEATCPPEKATVSVVAAPKRPSGYDIRMTPNPELPLGPFRFDVALTATTPDGVKHRCVAFRVSGEVHSPVRLAPDSVLLGEHSTGATVEAVVSVWFPAPGWTVDRVESELPTTQINRDPPLHDRPTYRVSQLIAKPGDGTAQIRFVCRKPNGQLETVPATIRWYGELMRLTEGKP